MGSVVFAAASQPSVTASDAMNPIAAATVSGRTSPSAPARADTWYAHPERPSSRARRSVWGDSANAPTSLASPGLALAAACSGVTRPILLSLTESGNGRSIHRVGLDVL